MIIEKTIKINAQAWAFWNALSSAKFIIERGGYYDCNWIANSQINWIANGEPGNFYGKLLQIKKMQYLSYLKYDGRLHHKVMALVCYQISSGTNDLVIKLSADLIQNSDKKEEELQSKWLDTHLTRLVALAEKIQLRVPSVSVKHNKSIL
jgi:hypothetical protein